MTKSQRILDLMQILRRHRHPVSGADLAMEAGVSLRTIYRDISALQALGASIEGERGIGYVLRPGFMLPPLMFSNEEIQALALGAQWVSEHTDPGLALAAANVLAKISAVLPADMRDELESDAFHVCGRKDGTEPPNLMVLRQAIREQRKVRITYVSTGEKRREHVIWPIGLGFDEGRQMIGAFCEVRQDYRVFSAETVSAAEMLPERYPGRRHEHLKKWWAKDPARCNAEAVNNLRLVRSSG
ncbi:YafY family protein [Methylobacterium bullatum]|nr:YafY family protein [Methylobacterium bullatum]MBD8903612.1 transcriptional regulator [Methylobacterium bullatum]